MLARRIVTHSFVLACVLLLLVPALVVAQEPIDQPPEFAEVRERFEDMKPADWEAAGYQVIPPGECVASPVGGMGVHAINPQLHDAQFQSGELDPESPPLILLDATKTRVVGLEWEAAEDGAPPELFGQTVPLLPGHPGMEEAHHMLHAYFRPNGQVLFAEFDPQVSCQLPPTSTAPRSGSETNPSGAWLVWLGLFTGMLAMTLRLLGRRRIA